MTMNTAAAAAPSIRRTVLIIGALIVLALLNLVLTLAMKDALLDNWVDSGRQAAGAPAYVGTAVLSFIISGLLYGALAYFLLQGKSWARIVLTVLGALGLLGVLSTFAATRPALFFVIAVIQAILMAAMLFFLWQKDSTAYLTGGRPNQQLPA